MKESDFRAEMIYSGCLTILRKMLAAGLITDAEIMVAEHMIRRHNNPAIPLISPCINLN